MSEELSNALDKLEIAPVRPMDSKRPMPFNDDVNNGAAASSMQLCGTQMFSSQKLRNCRKCYIARRSESFLGDLKPTNIAKGHRMKTIIKEPVLRALQICFHPQNSIRRKCVRAANSSSYTIKKDKLSFNRGMDDFRELIHECHSLLVEDVDFNGCLSQRNYRYSKNFTTMQTKISKDQWDTVCSKVASPPTFLSGIVTDHNKSSRYSTSCSQQAGNTGGSACDDVTIDELASYFDTLVHIPKKMSSMAEMMYI